MIQRLLRITDALAVLGAGALLAVVAASVAGRALFDLTGGGVNLLFQGAIELSTTALCLTVFAGLPRALADGLMRVDVVIERLPVRLARGLERLWSAALAGLGLVLAWRLAASAWTQAWRGDTTQDLAIPMAAITGGAALLALTLALVGLARALARDGGA